jgi:hypothetical protein
MAEMSEIGDIIGHIEPKVVGDDERHGALD